MLDEKDLSQKEKKDLDTQLSSLRNKENDLTKELVAVQESNRGLSILNGELLQKLAINEFVAYLSFSPYLKETIATLDVKTIAVISFALCGFANFGSIAVVVGAFSAVAPERASEIARLGFRALLAATLSNLMSATIAGLFIGLGSLLPG